MELDAGQVVDIKEKKAPLPCCTIAKKTDDHMYCFYRNRQRALDI